MRAAVHLKVDASGYVQGVCGAPNFDHAGTAPEGQAFFMLMEAAWQGPPNKGLSDQDHPRRRAIGARNFQRQAVQVIKAARHLGEI